MRLFRFDTKTLSSDAKFIIMLTVISTLFGLLAWFISYELGSKPIWEFFFAVVAATACYKYGGCYGILRRQRKTGPQLNLH